MAYLLKIVLLLTSDQVWFPEMSLSEVLGTLSPCTRDRVTVFVRLIDGMSFITFKCQLQ